MHIGPDESATQRANAACLLCQPAAPCRQCPTRRPPVGNLRLRRLCCWAIRRMRRHRRPKSAVETRCRAILNQRCSAVRKRLRRCRWPIPPSLPVYRRRCRRGVLRRLWIWTGHSRRSNRRTIRSPLSRGRDRHRPCRRLSQQPPVRHWAPCRSRTRRPMSIGPSRRRRTRSHRRYRHQAAIEVSRPPALRQLQTHRLLHSQSPATARILRRAIPSLTVAIRSPRARHPRATRNLAWPRC